MDVLSPHLRIMEANNSLNTTNVTSSIGFRPGLLSDAMYWRVKGVILALDILFGHFAVGANVITIIAYARMGFSDSTNISLTALAISDLGIALTTVSTALNVLLPAVLSVPFTRAIILPTSVTIHTLLSRISALITTYVSLERYLCVLLPLKIKTIITPKRTVIVMVTIPVGIFALYPAILLRYPIGWRFDSKQNNTVLDLLPVYDETVLFFENIYLFIMSTILPFLTFFAVVLCTILLSVSLQKSKVWREANKFTSRSTGGQPDQGSQSRLKQSKEIRAVKMVITIATVFIATSIPSCTQMIIIMNVPEFSFTGRYYRLFDIIGLSFVGMNSINSGANVIIYYRMSNKFRQAMLSLFCKE